MENIMSRLSPIALSLVAALAAIPAGAAQRAFVASSGSDANTASGCGLGAPCRSFASAMTVVNDGGEIVALDGAGFGAVTVTKNVTITANPGFYAGIAVASGNGVTMTTAGIRVILRGLNINGVGGQDGIHMTDGALLSIENCVISNFPNASGLFASVDGAAVRIVDSLIRDNKYGLFLQGGVIASISGSKILGSSQIGVNVLGAVASTTTTAALSDTTLSGNYIGVQTFSPDATATARASVTRSTVVNSNHAGLVSDVGNGIQIMTISNNLVTGTSNCGLLQNTGTGTTVLESLGNNTVRQNGTDACGTITTVSGI
jgi:hypothetical protein